MQVIFLSLIIKEKYIYEAIQSNYRRNLLTDKRIAQGTYSFKRLYSTGILQKCLVCLGLLVLKVILLGWVNLAEDQLER